MLLNDHGGVLDLHPLASVGLEAPVEGHGGVHVRGAVTGHVQHGAPEKWTGPVSNGMVQFGWYIVYVLYNNLPETPGSPEERLPVGAVDLPGQSEVGAVEEGLQQREEVARVDLAGEVLLVDGGQRQGVQGVAAPEMVPAYRKDWLVGRTGKSPCASIDTAINLNLSVLVSITAL